MDVMSRRAAALMGFQLSTAVLVAAEPGPDEPAPAEPADPLDRPVKGLVHRDSWQRMCKAVGEQIGLPVEFNGPALHLAGVSGPPPIFGAPDGTPGGAALWYCAIKVRQPNVVFVVRRDAAGAAKKIEFTSIEAAEKARTPLPCEARFLPGITPFLDPARHDAEPVRALEALARFGAEAEGAIPKIEAYAKAEGCREADRARAEKTLEAIRKAVAAKAKQP